MLPKIQIHIAKPCYPTQSEGAKHFEPRQSTERGYHNTSSVRASSSPYNTTSLCGHKKGRHLVGWVHRFEACYYYRTKRMPVKYAGTPHCSKFWVNPFNMVQKVRLFVCLSVCLSLLRAFHSSLAVWVERVGETISRALGLMLRRAVAVAR